MDVGAAGLDCVAERAGALAVGAGGGAATAADGGGVTAGDGAGSAGGGGMAAWRVSGAGRGIGFSGGGSSFSIGATPGFSL